MQTYTPEPPHTDPLAPHQENKVRKPPKVISETRKEKTLRKAVGNATGFQGWAWMQKRTDSTLPQPLGPVCHKALLTPYAKITSPSTQVPTRKVWATQDGAIRVGGSVKELFVSPIPHPSTLNLALNDLKSLGHDRSYVLWASCSRTKVTLMPLHWSSFGDGQKVNTSHTISFSGLEVALDNHFLRF